VSCQPVSVQAQITGAQWLKSRHTTGQPASLKLATAQRDSRVLQRSSPKSCERSSCVATGRQPPQRSAEVLSHLCQKKTHSMQQPTQKVTGNQGAGGVQAQTDPLPTGRRHFACRWATRTYTQATGVLAPVPYVVRTSLRSRFHAPAPFHVPTRMPLHLTCSAGDVNTQSCSRTNSNSNTPLTAAAHGPTSRPQIRHPRIRHDSKGGGTEMR
jgi:hypothetical protein